MCKLQFGKIAIVQDQGVFGGEGVVGFGWVESNVEEVVHYGGGFLISANGEEDGHDAAHHVPEEGLSLYLKAAEFILGGGRGGGRGGGGGGVATAVATATATTAAAAVAAAGERVPLGINCPLPFPHFQNLCIPH